MNQSSKSQGGSSRNTAVGAIAIIAIGALLWWGYSLLGTGSDALAAHPIMGTPVTGTSASRPAIQVDIIDASEWAGTAELYLAVQSSRSPSDCWTLLPINVGDFSGCMSRFVQLPFEVEPGDTVLFNLLDDDGLSSEEEGHIITACRGAGYCIWLAGTIYQPGLKAFVSPKLTANASELLGKSVLDDVENDKFDNYGVAEFIVQDSLPATPSQANKLSLIDEGKYVRVQLRLYGPASPLPLSPVTP